MARARANGLELEYDVRGDVAAPALLLVMGLGAQMIAWPEGLLDLLARRFRVIRFDNRDSGRSTWLDDEGPPNVALAIEAGQLGRPVESAYTLSDLAADAAALLDVLDIAAAHVVGASMGGFVAQQMAIDSPARVRTLTSIMSSTGDPELPPPAPAALAALLEPLPPGREAFIDRSVRASRAVSATGFPFDEEWVRWRAAASFDRGVSADGFGRQLLCVWASPSRKQALRAVRLPTLIIHGAADPLLPLAHGRATAEAIPGARLLVIDGMGHDLPRGAWPRVAWAIEQLAFGPRAS
jgi:pimeloyl-ACP methyl ester carboxylesterase